MAIRDTLYRALLKKTGSQQTMSRWAMLLAQEFGPMSPDEARLVMAHDFGIKLGDHGVPEAVQERIRTLRASGASLSNIRQGRQGASTSTAPTGDLSPATESRELDGVKPMTPATQFLSRNFHEEVVKRSRRLFSSGHRTEAISAAFRSVNNRVKRLSGIKGLDGVKLMNQALSDQSPALRLNDGSDTTELDEQQGLRYLMVGATLALRNPRVHEDDWPPDRNVNAALECLAYASLLHRHLDRCQEFEARGG